MEQRVMEILHLLADPPRFKKRLDQLQSQIDQAQSVIDLVGPAHEIEDIRARIDREKQEAEEAKQAARAEVEDILRDAEAEAEGVIESARKSAADLIDSADAKLKDANDRHAQGKQKLAESQRKETELRNLEETLQGQRAELTRKKIELDELETQLLKEKSDLAAVSERIKAVTG